MGQIGSTEMYLIWEEFRITVTLESEINVPVRLLILKDFPTRTALISDRTFIDSESSLL